MMRDVFMAQSIGAAAQFSSPKTLGGAGILLVASAGCTFPAPSIAQDEWTGPDKALHLGGSAVMGALATAMTDSNAKAFAGCGAVGALKELVTWKAKDVKPSGKDMAVNLLGCGLGVAGGRFVASQADGRVQVTYSWEY